MTRNSFGGPGALRRSLDSSYRGAASDFISAVTVHTKDGQYQTLSLRYQCGKLHQSALPLQVCEVAQYGPNIRALAVHLTQGQLLPFARACELIKDLYHLDISPATLLQWVHEGAQLLAPVVHDCWASLGSRKLQTYQFRHCERSAAIHGVGTPTWIATACGLAMTRNGCFYNFYLPYWSLNCDHSLCGAHLLRELIFQKETSTQAWAQHIIDCYVPRNKRLFIPS